MPTYPYPFLDAFSKIIVTTRDYARITLNSNIGRKKIWDDVAIFMKACRYENWDGEKCKTRIHTVISV